MDVKAEILDYIKCNETTGALLVTGPWGCGKSYLMKQIANELNREKKAAVAVISLFGLDSVPAINKRVKEAYTSFKLGVMGNNTKKVSKRFNTLVKDVLAVAGTAASGAPGLLAASQGIAAVMSYDVFSLIEVKNTVGNNEKERKFIIIFDDLERCGINNEKDLLGAINEFVENKQIKVIVVADEEKINKEEYKEYKEKLVSRTIYMDADYELMIESIVKNYTETSKVGKNDEASSGYRDFLIQSLDLLKQVFFESESYNVRTFKYILADFERVYAAWKETDVPIDNMKWVLYTFGAEVFISKMPKKEDNGSEKKTSAFFIGDDEKQYTYKDKHNSHFYPLCDWIKHGVWDKDSFIEALTQKYAPKEDETPLDRFLSYRIWDLRQKDIDNGLPEAVSLAYAGRLSKDRLITLIGKIHLLNQYEVPLPVDVDYSKIEEGLDKRFSKIINGTVHEPKSHTFIEASGADEEALDLIHKIERFDDRMEAASNRSRYLKLLTGDDSESVYSLKGLYIEEFDDEWLKLFIEKYTSVDNSGKIELARSLIDMVYDCSTYSTAENIEHTKANFAKLATYLEKTETDDSITLVINKSFVCNISGKLGNE